MCQGNTRLDENRTVNLELNIYCRQEQPAQTSLKVNISMLQGTDANLTTHFAEQEELSSYVNKKTYDVLPVADFPPGLDNTCMTIYESIR